MYGARRAERYYAYARMHGIPRSVVRSKHRTLLGNAAECRARCRSTAHIPGRYAGAHCGTLLRGADGDQVLCRWEERAP